MELYRPALPSDHALVFHDLFLVSLCLRPWGAAAHNIYAMQVKYDMAGQRSLALHADASVVTFQLPLNGQTIPQRARKERLVDHTLCCNTVRKPAAAVCVCVCVCVVQLPLTGEAPSSPTWVRPSLVSCA
jgi:hypothetical protein